ncbi:MAG: DUF4393 domain-containing protein [Burkholderiales bacterium]|nr:DUF4393 domain-containing protein [Burkholderiales bacterium]
MSDKSPDALAPTLAKLLPAVYADGFAPGVRQAGRALEAILGLLPTLALPIEWVNARARLWLEGNQRRYVARMAEVDERAVVEPPPEIGVPLIERMACTRDESLAALFVELLAKASTVSEAEMVHPAYARLLAEICPDEARLLAVFARDVHDGDLVQPAYPAVEVVAVGARDGRTRRLFGPLTELDLRVQFDHDEHLPLYLENLARLGVMSVAFDEAFVEDAYQGLKMRFSSLSPGHGAVVGPYRLGVLRVSLFGRLLVSACVPRAAWSIVSSPARKSP